MLITLLSGIIAGSRKLAIIGNGFDMAHGLKTSYRDFVYSQNHELFKEYYQFLKKYCGEDPHWYSFEERINDLSMKCFQCLYDDQYDYNEVMQDTIQINLIFRALHSNLSQYLNDEVASKKIKRKLSICKVIGRHTPAISFNYTDTAELYTKNVLYVHGSLKENEIVLGYDFRQEPCIIELEMHFWSKALCRERLHFSRFLKAHYNLSPKQAEYRECMADVEVVQRLVNSGRGFEDWTSLHHPDIIHEFYEGDPNKYSEVFDFVDPAKIKTIIVLGHSLLSDKHYLRNILNRCSKLKKVIIFTYDGESDGAIRKKKEFFQPYCEKIITHSY